MDYEKKYNEALEQAKRLYDGLDGYSSNRKVLEEIFPELRESEDETIIEGFRRLLDGIKRKGGLTLNKVPLDKCYAWLEKQKEQKPADWSEDDERKRLACIDTINEVIDYERDRWEDYNPGKPYRPITKYDEQIDWLKSLRPSWKPSDEYRLERPAEYES